MPFYIPLAFKNIFRQSRRSFSLGVNYLFISVLLLLLFSFSEGVKKNISENVITSVAGHLSLAGETVVQGRTFTGISGAPQIARTIKNEYPDSRILLRYSLSSAVYYKGLSKRLSFQGIDTQTDTSLQSQLDVQQGSWEAFSAQNNGVLLPKVIADYFDLKIGDEVVVAARTRYGAFNTATMQVKGIYQSANYFVQEVVISHFEFLRTLDLAPSDTATNIFVYFPSLKGLDAKRARIMDLLDSQGYKTAKPEGDSGGLAVVTAASPQYKMLENTVNEKRLKIATVDEVLNILSQILAAVNAGGALIAAILLFIIAVSIFINLRMSINERMKEIGTMRALGTRPADIIALFIFESVFLGLFFVGGGLFIGLLVVAFLALGPSFAPKGVLSLFLNNGHFVLVPTLSAVLGIAGTLALFTAVFSYFPARHGGKVAAIEALNKTT